MNCIVMGVVWGRMGLQLGGDRVGSESSNP
jgi:hypothetical protein